MPKHIQIPCPECQRTLRVRPEYVGRKVYCKHCQHKFLVPKYLVIRCPSCDREGRIRTENVGRMLNCKYCGSMLRAEAESGEVSAAPGLAAQNLGVSKAEDLPDLPTEPALESEVESLREELEARIREGAEALRGLDDARGQVRVLQGQVDDLNTQLAEARGRLAQTDAVLEQQKTAEAELTELRLRAQSLAQRSADLDLLQDEMQRQCELSDQLGADIARVKEELQQARAAAASAVLERDQAREQLEQLQAEWQASRADLAEASPAAAQQMADLELLKDELGRQSELSDQLGADVARLNEELQRARAAAASAVLERDQAREQLEQLQAEGQAGRAAAPDASLTAEIEHLRSELEAVRSELDPLRTEHGRMVVEHQAVEQEVERLRSFEIEREGIEEELVQARSERDRLRGELKEHQGASHRERTELEAERDRLRQALEAATAAHEEAKAGSERASELDQNLDSERALRLTAEQLVEQLRAQMEDAERRIEALTLTATEVDGLRQQVEASLGAEQEAARALADLQAEYDARLVELREARASAEEAAVDAGRLVDHEAQLAEFAGERDRLQALVAQREAELAATAQELVAARDEFEHEFDRVQQQWDAERQALQSQSEQEKEGVATQAEARVRAEESRLVGERIRWQERIDADRLQFEQDCQALRLEIDRHGKQVDQLQAERDEALRKLESANGLLAEFQPRVAQLEAKLSEQTNRVEDERHQHDVAMASLERKLKEAETARDEAVRMRAPAPARAEKAGAAGDAQLAEERGKTKAAQERADKLESELKAAHDQIDELCRDLALHHWGQEEAPVRPAGEPADPQALQDLQRQVAALTEQLKRSQNESAQLRSILDYLGVHEKTPGR